MNFKLKLLKYFEFYSVLNYLFSLQYILLLYPLFWIFSIYSFDFWVLGVPILFTLKKYANGLTISFE